MSYEKQNWKNGDVITETKLNHMEDGIATGGVLVVNGVYDEQAGKVTLDKTWQEIYDATLAIIVDDVNNDGTAISVEYIMSFGSIGGTYSLTSLAVGLLGTKTATYTCDSADGYPSATTEG